MLPTKATRLPPDQPAVKHRETFMPITVDVPQRTDAFPAPTNRSLSRRRFGTMALASGAAAWLSSLSAQALPASEEARVIDFEWVDPTRDRAVPARLYWPASATRKGPVPLIVFSHGLGGSRKGYSYLGEGWSARGIAEPAHPARRQRPDALGGQPDTAPRPSRWGSGRAGSHRADAGREVRPRPPASIVTIPSKPPSTGNALSRPVTHTGRTRP